MEHMLDNVPLNVKFKGGTPASDGKGTGLNKGDSVLSHAQMGMKMEGQSLPKTSKVEEGYGNKTLGTPKSVNNQTPIKGDYNT